MSLRARYSGPNPSHITITTRCGLRLRSRAGAPVKILRREKAVSVRFSMRTGLSYCKYFDCGWHGKANLVIARSCDKMAGMGKWLAYLRGVLEGPAA
jgi:hypothetical protein